MRTKNSRLGQLQKIHSIGSLQVRITYTNEDEKHALKIIRIRRIDEIFNNCRRALH